LKPYLTPTDRQAAWNLTGLVSATILSQLCGITNIVFLTDSLGLQQYGRFAFALSIQGYLAILGAVGLRQVVTRELSQSPEKSRAVVTVYVVATGVLSLGLGLLVTLIAQSSGLPQSERELLIFIAIGNIAASATPLPMFDAKHRQAQGAWLVVLVEVTALGIVVWCSKSHCLTLRLAGTIFAAKWWLSTGLLWLTFWKLLGGFHWCWDLALLKRLLKSSWPMMVAGLMGMIPVTSGVFWVRHYHGLKAAGVMSVATQGLQAFLMLNALTLRVLQPHIAGPAGEQPYLHTLARSLGNRARE
ncbi:MAG: oligosaccharide flippase family protein, partial [Planctomycetaceae bacterium]|nr:oligosaccharide flippase family protein [Planctomycetaceae bacterium]